MMFRFASQLTFAEGKVIRLIHTSLQRGVQSKN
jgi:hypothetical protein